LPCDLPDTGQNISRDRKNARIGNKNLVKTQHFHHEPPMSFTCLSGNSNQIPERPKAPEKCNNSYSQSNSSSNQYGTGSNANQQSGASDISGLIGAFNSMTIGNSGVAAFNREVYNQYLHMLQLNYSWWDGYGFTFGKLVQYVDEYGFPSNEYLTLNCKWIMNFNQEIRKSLPPDLATHAILVSSQIWESILRH
jgi:hypothetical protein